MRIILYTGKGGVGKTSIAAATACYLAGRGKKVLIMSTDQAHSLRDSFQVKLGAEPVKIKENLHALEIDALIENQKLWGSLKGYIEQLFFMKAEHNISNEELLVFPGFEELLALLKIKELDEAGDYDVLIVDCAPTGETLSLLKFPELFKYWMEKIFPMKKKALKFVRPVVGSLMKIPLPEDKAMDEMELIHTRLDELHTLLLDQSKTSLRIVTTPEKIVIREARRSFSCIHMFDFNVDAVIVNKIIPGEGISGYFSQLDGIQEAGLELIRSCFAPVPIFYAPLLEDELKGLPDLEKMGTRLYAQQAGAENDRTDPAAILRQGKIFEIEKEEKDYILKIHMPVENRAELNLLQKGDELCLALKNEKRTFSLPKKLQSRQVSRATFDAAGYLVIRFT